ncbi:YbaK/aminoacyl-tRNA synthetase-associated domain, partial [Striga asiatica]
MDNLASVYKSMKVAGVNILLLLIEIQVREETQTGVDIRQVQDNGETELQNLNCTKRVKKHNCEFPEIFSVKPGETFISNQEKGPVCMVSLFWFLIMSFKLVIPSMAILLLIVQKFIRESEPDETSKNALNDPTACFMFHADRKQRFYIVSALAETKVDLK